MTRVVIAASRDSGMTKSWVRPTDNADHAIAGALHRRGRGIGHRRAHATTITTTVP